MAETARQRFRARQLGTVRADLGRLAFRLNRAYGVDLAQVLPDRRHSDDTPCLVLGRGMSVDDVIVAVSIGHQLDRPTYNVAVFTCTAWFEYGDPFVTHPFYTDMACQAASWIFHFVPSHPEVFPPT